MSTLSLSPQWGLFFITRDRASALTQKGKVTEARVTWQGGCENCPIIKPAEGSPGFGLPHAHLDISVVLTPRALARAEVVVIVHEQGCPRQE